MDSSIFAKLRAGFATSSAEEMQALGTELAGALPADRTLALHGDLGVGKTTLVQGLAKGFGVTDQVTSPTFAIYSVHRGANRTLIHLDAYRLENERQLEELLLEEFLVSPFCLAVEWPERIAGWVSPDAWHLALSIDAQQRHHVRLR